MKKVFSIIMVFSLIFLVGCKQKKEKESEEQKVEDAIGQEEKTMDKIKVEMVSKSGSTVKGNVVFTEDNGVVTMVAVFDGLEPGDHAIHLHEKSDCSAEDGSSAGGHWNPTMSQHGKWGDEAGYHKGDIGNFVADATGQPRKKLYEMALKINKDE